MGLQKGEFPLKLAGRVPRNGGVRKDVIPKKTAIKTLGRGVTFQDVLDHALRTDLVDNKTLTFSGTEYG